MRKVILLLSLLLSISFVSNAQVKPTLGTTANFTVLAGTEIVNSDSTVIYGNTGVWPGLIITGFPPGIVYGTQYPGTATAQTSQADLTSAYNQAAAQVPGTNLSGQNLNSLSLLPGVYRYDANANLNGTLTFDASGNPNAVFIIQVLGDLTTSPNAAMNLRGGARPSNIFWQIGGSVTVGQRTNLVGSFLINQSATLNNLVTLQGRILARSSFVHLSKNNLVNPLPTSDLAITKTVSSGPYSRGQQVTFRIIIKNNGPSDETTVLVRDRLPSGLTYISSTTTTTALYDAATGLWALPLFNNGASDTLNITARIDTTGFITNTATVAGAGIDSDQSNNASSVTICATPSQAGPITGPVSLCLDSTQTQTYTYSIQPVKGATSYKWYTPTGWNIVGRTDTTFITVIPGIDTLSATIVVAPVNVCGESPPSTTLVFATNIPPATPGAITGDSNMCIAQTGLTYTVSSVWGASSYSWAVPTGWTINSGQGSTTITVTAGSSPGAISVRATNACGTSSAVNFLVSPVGTPPAQPGPIIGDSIPCVTSGPVAFSVPVVANADTYNWSVPAGWTILSGQGTKQILAQPGITGGVISVYTQNACGFSTPATLVVNPANVRPVAPASINGTISICSGQQLTYSVAAIVGVSAYTWTVPAGWTINSGQGTTSISVTAGAAGGTITVAASNGCGTSATVSLAVSIGTIPPVPGPITGDSIPCNGSLSNTYSVAVVPGASAYSWLIPTGWTIISGQGTRTIVVSAGTTGGIISVRATNACGSSAPRTVTVNPAIVVPAAASKINGPLNICNGQTSLTYTVTPVSGASLYNWTVPAGWVITSGQGTPSITVTAGNSAGIIAVTSVNGCGNGGTANLNVSPSSAAPAQPGIIAGENLPCSGSANNIYSITNVAGASSYNWTVPAGWVITAGQGTSSITVIAGTSGGNITVTAINACGSSTGANLTVTPSPGAPVMPGSISGNTIPCFSNSNNIYSITPVSGASSYVWTVPAGWVITSGQGTSSITVTAGNTAGIISVRASNGCGNGPVSILALTPASAPPAQPGAIIGDSLPCAGNSSAVYSIAPVIGASTYNWTVPAGWNITFGQGTPMVTVAIGSGKGTISVTASNSCGTGAASILIGNPVTQAPASPSPITGDTAICGGSVRTYSTQIVANASAYIWNLPAGWKIISGDSSTAVTVSASNVGGTVSVLASNGCGTSTPVQLPVAVQALPGTPVITAGDSLPCINNQTTVYTINPVSNADNYSWTVPAGWAITNGQGSTSITVTTGINSGYVQVVASNSCGNGAPDSIQVTPQSVVPAIPLSISGDSIPCVGSLANAYVIAPVPGASGYNWTVPAGWTITQGQGTTNISVITGTSSGFITVSAVNGCGVGSAATMPVNPATTLPSIIGPIAGTPITCAGQTGLIFSIAQVVSASSYTWTVPAGWTITNGQGTNAITVTAGNTAGTIAVTASNGCGTQTARTQAVNITTLAPPAPIIIYGDPVPCQGMQTATYRIDPVQAASTYTWTVPSDWQIVSGQGTVQITANVGTIPGTISVTASNTCGTSLATSFTVKSSAVSPVKPGPVSGTTVACVNDSTVIYQIAPLNTASAYVWSVPAGWQILTGDGTPTIRVLAGSGSGFVKVYAYNGCGKGDTSVLAVKAATSLPGTLGPITGDSNVCDGQRNLTYQVKPESDIAYYQWTVPQGWAIASGQGTPVIQVIAGTTSGNITISAENGCGTGLTNEKAVSVKPQVAVLGNIINKSTACKGLLFEVETVAGATSYTWTVPAGWTITEGQGTTIIKVTSDAKNAGIVSVTAGNGNCMSQPVTLLADPQTGNPELEFQNAFSPNNDGINETWEIKNLQNYQANELVIINRWGNEVYKTRNYSNNWNGGNLSAGTYFYVMKVTMCDGSEKSYKGYVMIVK